MKFMSARTEEPQAMQTLATQMGMRRLLVARPRAAVTSNPDVLVVLLLLAMPFVFAVYRRASPIVVGRIMFLDDSWNLDILYKATKHIWLGKDVIFTYGPLSQVLMFLAPPWGHLSLGSGYVKVFLFSYYIAVVSSWLISRLLLNEQPVVVRTVYLCLLVPLCGDAKSVVATAVFALLAYVEFRSQISQWAKPAIAAALITVGFLFSADAGVYACIAWTIVSAAGWATNSHNQLLLARLRGWLATITCFLGLAILVNTIFSRPLDWTFWHASFEMVRSYRWAMAVPSSYRRRLFLFVICWLLFAQGLKRRTSEKQAFVHTRAFLLAAAAYSAIAVQSYVVRSDQGHLLSGFFPALAFASSVAIVALRSVCFSKWQKMLVAGGLAILMIAAQVPWSSLRRMISAGRLSRNPSCSSETDNLDGLCVSHDEFKLFSAVVTAFDGIVPKHGTVFAFPYENILGDYAGRHVAGGILQNYAAAGDYLKGLQITSLDKHKPSAVIYSAAALPIDGVPNLTRTPEIWFYLQSHYTKVSDVGFQTAVLRRDEGRNATWYREYLPLDINPNGTPIQDGRPIEFDIRNWPEFADFLSLTITVHSPVWWRAGKPPRLQVDIERSNATHKQIAAIAEPNRPYEVVIYVGDDRRLANYFDADDRHWREDPNLSAVRHVRLSFSKFDNASVMPTSVTVERANAIRLGLHEVHDHVATGFDRSPSVAIRKLGP